MLRCHIATQFTKKNTKKKGIPNQLNSIAILCLPFGRGLKKTNWKSTASNLIYYDSNKRTRLIQRGTDQIWWGKGYPDCCTCYLSIVNLNVFIWLQGNWIFSSWWHLTFNNRAHTKMRERERKTPTKGGEIKIGFHEIISFLSFLTIRSKMATFFVRYRRGRGRQRLYIGANFFRLHPARSFS